MNMNEKIKKKLGLNKTFVQTLSLNDDDFKFMDNFVKNVTVIPVIDIDKYIFENCKADYKKSGLFQSIYCFLSKFEFKNSDDFKSCLEELKQAVLHADLKDLDRKMKLIKKTHKQSISECGYDDKEFTALQNCLNNTILIDELQKILDNEQNLNQINIPNFFIASDLVADIVLLWLFAREDLNNIDIKQYIKSENRNSFIVDYLKKRLSINDDKSSKRIFIHFLQEQYLAKGYLFHGTNSMFLTNIMHNGIDCNAIKLQTKDIIAADNIMQKYGMKNVFCGKISELSQIKYFLSSKIQTSTFYAYQSPEYLSRFCANGWHLNPIDYDTFAYYRKDYKACLNNFETLFNKHNFSLEDRKTILKIFSKLWRVNVNKTLTPVMIFIPRQAIGCENESVDELCAHCGNLTYLQIFEEFINKRISFVNRYAKIHPNSIKVVYLPNLLKMFKLSSNCRQLTFCLNDKTVVADGYIPIFTHVEATKPFLIKLDNTTEIGQECACLSKLDVNNTMFDDRPIGMVIAEEGVAFNENFNHFKKAMQDIYSLDEICKKDYLDAKLYIKKSESLAENDIRAACFYYMKALRRIANAYTMAKFNKYKCDIDYGTFWEIENKFIDDREWSGNLIRNGIFNDNVAIQSDNLKTELLNMLNRLESLYLNE